VVSMSSGTVRRGGNDSGAEDWRFSEIFEESSSSWDFVWLVEWRFGTWYTWDEDRERFTPRGGGAVVVIVVVVEGSVVECVSEGVSS